MTKENPEEFHPNMLKLKEDSPAIKCYCEDFGFSDIPLGQGGFGVVLKALHLQTRSFVAMKLQPIIFDPHSDEAKNPAARARTYLLLKREINGLRMAKSEYITRYFGFMIVDKNVVLCMEVMDLTSKVLYEKVKEKENGKFM